MQAQQLEIGPAVVPYSVEAEMAVISAMLIDADAATRALDALQPSDFYRQPHELIFEAVGRLVGRGVAVDAVTIGEELKRSEALHKVGGLPYVGELLVYMPTAANIDHHIRIVAEKAQLRRLQLAGREITELAHSGKPASEVHERAETLIFAAAERSVTDAPLAPIRSVINDVYEALERDEKDVMSGFKDLDHLTGGFARGDLVILAARPSMGKTAAGMQWAVNIAFSEKKPVAVFSLEMSKEAIGRRMLFTEARVDGARFNVEDESALARMAQATGILAGLPLFIHDRANTVRTIRTHCRRLVMEHGAMGAVVVDYLGKLRGTRGTEDRVQELGEITGDLKALAVELECPVIALCQLSRKVEGRPDKRPMLSDLRDSGEIEQDADTVVMLYRPEYYSGPTDKDGNSLVGKAEVLVTKQRNGATGSVDMYFHAQYTRFEDVHREAR